MCAKVFCPGLVMVVGVMTLTALAETNSMPPFASLFVHPELQLPAEFTELPSLRPSHQQLKSKAGSSPAEMTSAQTGPRQADAFILTTDRGDGEFQNHQHFDIVSPVHESNDRVTRCFDYVFRPEEFHLGKTTVSCSIVTAIKRKNPLCLINPNFFNVSW